MTHFMVSLDHCVPDFNRNCLNYFDGFCLLKIQLMFETRREIKFPFKLKNAAMNSAL